ncbi:hypothetical protein [Lysinibacillus sp. NPDC086135]|uniref:hypothetical protein n=1 Tax=Lysinibacillus sp. NPDC086135 TaxID=3364130 RepID=UPI00382665F3
MKNLIDSRIEKLKELIPNNLSVSVKKLGGKIYANCKGNSIIVKSPNQFNEWLRTMNDFVEPERIELTSRISKIENEFIKNI